jgi:uncharacterized membrane protein
MSTAAVLNVTLYTRKDCGLCDEVKAQLKELQHEFPHRLAEVDIDSDPVLQSTYSEKIPVVEVGPYRLQAPINRAALAMTLGAARDRRGQLQESGGAAYQERVRKGEVVTRSDRLYLWISKHYLALLNLIVFIYVGLPFTAPVFMKLGLPAAAGGIYRIYSPLCHQFGFRSFFLFGEQPYYPLREAGLTNLQSFQQITGYADVADTFNPSRLSAREFVGDTAVGFKVALCERDVAIYASIVLFGLVYALTRRRLPPLHWLLWFVFALGPIGLDGFSQLLSQLHWAWLQQVLPYRESTPMLRVLTGLLFGFGTAWFALPNIEDSMRETRQFLIKKFAVVGAGQ